MFATENYLKMQEEKIARACRDNGRVFVADWSEADGSVLLELPGGRYEWHDKNGFKYQAN